MIYKHALRNALIPMVTILTLSVPGLFGGALITETVFAYPGVGRMLYQAVLGKDYAVAMADILFLALLDRPVQPDGGRALRDCRPTHPLQLGGNPWHWIQQSN